MPSSKSSSTLSLENVQHSSTLNNLEYSTTLNTTTNNTDTINNIKTKTVSLSSSSSSSTISNGNKSLKSCLTNTTSNSSTLSMKHYDSIISELRCPGCALPMSAPIKLCISGHSVCEKCILKLSGCPLCSEKFTETRSVTLEALSAKAQFNCCNANRGCTVRLPLELMKSHEKNCNYQIGNCFMGKVWGGCNWSGCEMDWIDHCLNEHGDKVWLQPIVNNTWNYEYKTKTKPIIGYYMFRVFNETFNVYHMYDKPKSKVIWTTICASKNLQTSQNYAFEIELYIPNDPSRLLIQRLMCHNEKNEDILAEGTCAMFDIADIMRFLDAEKILHYRIKIIDISMNNSKLHEQQQELIRDITNLSIDIDYSLTTIEGSNSKNIPSGKIITKERSTAVAEASNNFPGKWSDMKITDYDRNKLGDCFTILRDKYNSIKSMGINGGEQFEKDNSISIFKKEFNDYASTSTSEMRVEQEIIKSTKVNSIPKPPRNSKLLSKSNSIDLTPLNDLSKSTISLPELPVPSASKEMSSQISIETRTSNIAAVDTTVPIVNNKTSKDD